MREGLKDFVALPPFNHTSLASSLAIIDKPELLGSVVNGILGDARQVLGKLKGELGLKFDASEVLKEVDAIIEGVKHQVRITERVKHPDLLNARVEFI